MRTPASDTRTLGWQFFLPLVLLCLTALSGTALGMAWAWLSLWGLWTFFVLWPRHRAVIGRRDHPALRYWSRAVMTGFGLQLAATLYWQEPLQDLHGEIRLLLGLTTIGALQAYFLNAPERRQLWVRWISHTLSFSALAGLVWVTWAGRTGLTTHPIPWAGVMAIFSCWLLALGWDERHPRPHRKFWLAGSFLAVLAVLASQSRGAFVALGWWVACMAYQSWRRLEASPPRLRLSWHGVRAATAWVLVLAALALSPVLERPLSSLQEAVDEVQMSVHSARAAANSSVGARLYMWQRSLEVIPDSPWLGHGKKEAQRLLHQWSEDAHSDEISRLAHVHNEYLNLLLEHGALGLSSQGAYLLGLALVVMGLGQTRQACAAWVLAGIGVVHAFGSLSNVNFAHNYYTTGLSLMVVLTLGLLVAQTDVGQTPKDRTLGSQ